MKSIMEEKLDQSQEILNELDLDAWLIFVRETTEACDPILPLLLNCELTWKSALVISRAGERVAIVGKYDDDAVRASAGWNKVIPYVQEMRGPLLNLLGSKQPTTIAINYSTNDHIADGLTHGMFLKLQEYLEGTEFENSLVGAEELVAGLRGRKSETELRRIRAAVETTESIFTEVGRFARPGRTEREIADFMRSETHRRGVEPAWSSQCPIVNTGPNSQFGHGIPSEIAIEPGHILHIDFGVKQDGYCSDMQRCWYIPRAGETGPPLEVRRAFDAIVDAISAAAKALRPGTEGWQVDAQARQSIIDAGYPEYQHSVGHHVGRSIHDGAGVLGPKWERYGNMPLRRIEIGNVFTLEPSIEDAGGHGCMELEEMVVVTANGCEWLSERQLDLPCVQHAE